MLYEKNLNTTIKMDTDTTKQINDLIHEAVGIRRDKNISQVTISKKLDISQQFVSALESGVYKSPTLYTFIKYLNTIGLKLKIEGINKNE